MPFSVLLAGYGTTSLGEGMQVESVFALLKVRAEDGSPAWSVRSGARPCRGGAARASSTASPPRCARS